MPVTRILPALGLPYHRAADTDIRKTFARIARERKPAEQLAATEQQLNLEASSSTIVQLPARGRSAS